MASYPWTASTGLVSLTPGGALYGPTGSGGTADVSSDPVPPGIVEVTVEVRAPVTVGGAAANRPYFRPISFDASSAAPLVPPTISVAGTEPQTPIYPANRTFPQAAWVSGVGTAVIRWAHPGGYMGMQIARGSGWLGSSVFFGDPVMIAPTVYPGTTPPTITKLIPTSGPDTGGTVAYIAGADLTGATAVDFGGTAGTGLTVDPSGNLATVTSPAHTAGPAPVTITTPAGTSNAETFTFEAPPPPGTPTLTGIDPASGPETGGTPVLLTGTNLAGTTSVVFGGTPATIITATDTALLVTTPAHTAGTVDVTATDGTTTTDPLAFEYTEATGPVIDGPDVIANLVALLTSELGVPVSSRRSPTATKDSDPSVVVRRTGGPSKGVASDNPTITIEAWAPTTTESFQLLQSARMVVIEAAEQGRAGLRRYDEFAGPADLPDPSTTNPRHTLTASVVTRIE